MCYNARYSGSNKQVPGATTVCTKKRAALVSRTWESLTEVTFELRLKKKSDDRDGEESQTDDVAKHRQCLGARDWGVAGDGICGLI